jgi:hypothetical protein
MKNPSFSNSKLPLSILTITNIALELQMIPTLLPINSIKIHSIIFENNVMVSHLLQIIVLKEMEGEYVERNRRE